VLCTLLNILHAHKTVYYQGTNSTVERFHCCLKDTVQASCATDMWAKHLSQVLLGMRIASLEEDGRTSACAALCQTSFYLSNFFGFRATV
jgi:hypothetical protein